MNTVSIRPMLHDDCLTALSILNGSLGEGYVPASDLEKRSDSRSLLAYVAENGDCNPIGVMTGNLLLPGASLDDVVHHTFTGELQRLVPESRFSRIGILKSGAVLSEARGTGVGTELAARVTDQLFRNGATCVLALAWIDDDGCHAEGMLKRIGFQNRGDILDLWRQHSIDQGYDCPSCGSPCRCAGRIFVHFRHRWAYNSSSRR